MLPAAESVSEPEVPIVRRMIQAMAETIFCMIPRWYSTDMKALKKMMKDLETDDAVIGKNPNTIQNVVMKRARVNGVYNLTPRNLKIKRRGVYNVVTLNYTVSKTLAGNMEVVMTFEETANIHSAP